MCLKQLNRFCLFMERPYGNPFGVGCVISTNRLSLRDKDYSKAAINRVVTIRGKAATCRNSAIGNNEQAYKIGAIYGISETNRNVANCNSEEIHKSTAVCTKPETHRVGPICRIRQFHQEIRVPLGTVHNR